MLLNLVVRVVDSICVALGRSFVLVLLCVWLVSTALFTGAVPDIHAGFLFSLSLLPSLALSLVLLVQCKDYRDRRKAVQSNARLPPRILDRSIGGLDTVLAIRNNFERGYFGDHLALWSNMYGPVVNIRILFENRIFTTEPEHIKSMLTTDFMAFEKGTRLRGQFQSLFGTGIFNVDGDMWKFHRGLCRRFLTKERISDFRIYTHYADRAVDVLFARVQSGYAVDFQDFASRYTLDCTANFLFGYDINALSDSLPYPWASGVNVSSKSQSELFLEGFAAGSFQTSIRIRYGPFWPMFELGGDKVKQSLSPVYHFMEPIVRKALDRKRIRSMEGKVADRTLLDYMVEQSEDVQTLLDWTVTMLIAGRDANTCLLTSTIYALTQNPSIVARLRHEISESLGTQVPTVKDLRALKYLHAVLCESLRLWPPIPINFRTSTQDVLWAPVSPDPRPFHIPAGTECAFSVFLMQRRTDLWGPDAADYDPDRFLDERYHKYLVPNPYIFLPFIAGPRMCMGSQVAYDEAAFFLVRLFQTFSEIALDSDATPPDFMPPWNDREKVWLDSHLSLHFKGGVWVRMASDRSAM
ncbi:cytochrome P450 monooxygenase pc-3 [Favolaschia claudopus]|uniref:Cytochrome P450 monooxygenase pc-3 n=1 Tax=Favolaschia claudopus TaxID=2862362 RepID=A0AAW0E4K6_9AGAR